MSDGHSPTPFRGASSSNDVGSGGRSPVMRTERTRIFNGQRNEVIDRRVGGRANNRQIHVGNVICHDVETAVPAGAVLFQDQQNTLRDESNVEDRFSRTVMGSIVQYPAPPGPTPRDTT